jgi:hypothetical protein
MPGVERDSGPIVAFALIDDFIIDCVVQETHALESEITEFPRESGGNVSDNIRPKPVVVTMECIVSDTPLDPVIRFRKDGQVPTDDAYALLKSIRQDRRVVEIVTSLDTYANMGLETLSIPRASGRGDELRFTATFKQVQIVENRRTVRVAVPGAVAPRVFQVVLSKDTPVLNEIATEALHTLTGGKFDEAAARKLKSQLKGLRFDNVGQKVPVDAFHQGTGAAQQEPNVSVPSTEPIQVFGS